MLPIFTHLVTLPSCPSSPCFCVPHRLPPGFVDVLLYVNNPASCRKLAESLLLNLCGHVDDVSALSPPLCSHPFLIIVYSNVETRANRVATAFKYIDHTETKAFELANLEVFISAVLYNLGAGRAALALMQRSALSARTRGLWSGVGTWSFSSSNHFGC